MYTSNIRNSVTNVGGCRKLFRRKQSASSNEVTLLSYEFQESFRSNCVVAFQSGPEWPISETVPMLVPESARSRMTSHVHDEVEILSSAAGNRDAGRTASHEPPR